jgi:hypothetical protein
MNWYDDLRKAKNPNWTQIRYYSESLSNLPWLPYAVTTETKRSEKENERIETTQEGTETIDRSKRVIACASAAKTVQKVSNNQPRLGPKWDSKLSQ